MRPTYEERQEQRQAEMRAQAADARQRAIGWAVAAVVGALFWAWVLGFFA